MLAALNDVRSAQIAASAKHQPIDYKALAAELAVQFGTQIAVPGTPAVGAPGVGPTVGTAAESNTK